MSAGTMPRRRVVPVATVREGDEIESGGQMVSVTANVFGTNGQRYLVTESQNGAVLVHEFDPQQKVTVWR